MPPGCGYRTQRPGGDLRGRGAGPQPDAVNAHPEVGERASYFVLAGDDDQCIFSFAGASPDAILDPDIPDDHKIVLKQSYRVPRAVHQVADGLIHQVTRRQEKIYLARPEVGAVHRLSTGTYKSPEYFILKSAEEHLKQGKTVMFLAACSYMLQPVVAALRKRGVPFHNPYRKSNGFWNPLRIGKKGSSASRVFALLVAHPDFGEGLHPWTYGDLALWVDCVASQGILKNGMKEKLQQYDRAQTATMERLDEVFETDALNIAYGCVGRRLPRAAQLVASPDNCRRPRSFPVSGRCCRRVWAARAQGPAQAWWSEPSTPSRAARPM